MNDTTLHAAVTRLERAIARLERQPPSAAPPADAALATLAARHDRLRTQVGAAIARLDTLIAEAEG